MPLVEETHGGEDVNIYAGGAMSHLFKGTKQQHFIAHAMMYAACIGPNKDLCISGPSFPGCPNAGGQLSGHWLSVLCLSVGCVLKVLSHMRTLL